MDPSSLIFVAIIGVWAAYLVPHWTRRREDLSQSRTPDRFSDRARVLDPRSRPLERPGGPSSGRLLVRGDDLLDTPDVPAATGEFPAVARTSRADVGEGWNDEFPPEGMYEAYAASLETGGPTCARPASRPRQAVARRARDRYPAARRRAMVLGTLMLCTAVAWIGAVAYVLPVWPAMGMSLLLAVDLVLLRAVARQRLLVPRGTPALPARRTASASPETRSQPGARAARPRTGGLPVLGQEVAASAGQAVAPRTTAATENADTQSVEVGGRDQGKVAVPGADGAFDGGGTDAAATRPVGDVAPASAETSLPPVVGALGEQWQPVPVPPPTYTLKPAVHRPAPPALDTTTPVAGTSSGDPGAGAGVSGTAEPDDVPELDLDAVLARRRAASA